MSDRDLRRVILAIAILIVVAVAAVLARIATASAHDGCLAAGCAAGGREWREAGAR